MKVKKEDLYRALDLVKAGLANKEIVPQSTSFAFKNGKVFTYNDEISVSHPVEGIEIEGAIKADELYNFLRKVRKDEVDISVDGDQTVLKAGRAKVWFSVVSEILLPIDEEIGNIDKWNDLPEGFLDAVNFAVPCASDDMGNPKITCVNFRDDGKIEATDNYRVVRWDLNVSMPFENVLVPATSMKEVMRLKPIKIAEGKGWLHFQNKDETIISCRVFNEKFVNVDGILSSVNNEGILFTFPRSTERVLERAEAFTKSQSKLTNDEVIDVLFRKGKLIIKCETETARFREPIPVKNYDGEDFEFQITPYLLKDILQKTSMCLIMEGMLKFEGENWVYLSTLRK